MGVTDWGTLREQRWLVANVGSLEPGTEIVRRGPRAWVRLSVMARSIWSGALSFGLVNVPVALYPATRDRTIRFHQLQAGTSDRIRYKKVNERTGKEVPPSEIVKGVEVGDGEYVILSDSDLEAAEPARSRSIEITDFVERGDVDPIGFRASYYLAPQGEHARRAYALLRRAMAESNKVGVATLVMRNKEYLVTIHPGPEVMVLETMYFADEIRSPSEVLPDMPGDEVFSERELATAALLIDSMTSEWEPQRYRDTYREAVLEIVERKRAGEEIVVQEAPPPPKVVDLMAALQASVDAISHQGTTKAPARRGRSTARPSGGKSQGRARATGAASGRAEGERRASTPKEPAGKKISKRKVS